MARRGPAAGRFSAVHRGWGGAAPVGPQDSPLASGTLAHLPPAALGPPTRAQPASPRFRTDLRPVDGATYPNFLFDVSSSVRGLRHTPGGWPPEGNGSARFSRTPRIRSVRGLTQAGEGAAPSSDASTYPPGRRNNAAAHTNRSDGINEITPSRPRPRDCSYLLVSGDEAAVIDPQRDIAPVLAAAASRGATVRWALDTHVHNDYVSGAREVAAATGATAAGPAGAWYGFHHVPLVDGAEIAVGDALLRALHTPGHTPEHTSYLLPHDLSPAVFTGGSLLVGRAGRSDLLGAEHAAGLAGPVPVLASAAALSRHPGLPTHGAGIFCAATSAARAWSPVRCRGDQLRAASPTTHFSREHLRDCRASRPTP